MTIRFLLLVASPFHLSFALAEQHVAGRGGPEFSGLSEMNTVAAAEATSVYAIVGGRLIDGWGGPALESSCVLVRGNRIEEVGARDEIDIPEDAKIVDAPDKSVLPGLFDSHFHSIDNLVTPIEYELRNGITSFRDPGHPFKYYSQLLSSDLTIPRVFLCGGHLDAEPVVHPDQAMRIESAAGAREAVETHVDRGASAIKVYFRLPLEPIRVACEAAAVRGVPVTAHLELVDADDAIRAGVIGIEHISSFGTAIATPEDAEQFRQAVREDSSARRAWRHRLWSRIAIEDNLRADALIKLIVDRGVFVSPTLAIFEARAGDADATAERLAGFENMMKFFTRLYQAGAKIAVGSHTSAPHAAEGKAYLREVELMAEAGMTPLEIIAAATKTNADFFGAADRLGTIEPGKVADLVIIDGDPSNDISLIDQIDLVMLNGRWIVE